MRLLLNGKPFNRQDLEDAIFAEALEQLTAQLQDRLSDVRDPETGEPATLLIEGTSLDSLTIQVQGTPVVLEHARRLLDDSSPGDEPTMADRPIPSPRVFLCHASEDKELVKRIAAALQESGIDTWYDEWEIRNGDSVRQRIDEGLASCTHFLVLLTRTSLTKSWVNLEMDAGLVRMLNEQTRFIPLRRGVSVDDLPITLQTLHSPQLTDIDVDLPQLVNDIFGLTRKPPLGIPPPAVIAKQKPTGLSDAATAVARLFVERSTYGMDHDPQLDFPVIADATGLTADDVEDAVHELRLHLTEHGYSGGARFARPKPSLFATFDHFWKPWRPREDALHLARRLMGEPDFPADPVAIAARMSWEPRRLNPALAYLQGNNLAEMRQELGMREYIAARIRATPATRRFVKDNEHA